MINNPIIAYIKKLYHKFRSAKTRYQIAIGIILLAAIIASKFLLGHGYMPQVKVVETYKASKGNLLQTTRLLGMVEAQKLFTGLAGYEGTVSYVPMLDPLLKLVKSLQKSKMM